MFPNFDEDFGGLHVYMFGNFRQLQPVRDTPLYDNKFTDSMASNGSLIFQNFEKVVELSVCHCQSSDIEL